MAQIVYYFYSALALGVPHDPVSFVVPTGNFGDIFAGFAAQKMGLPIEKLVIATNENDILARTLATGRYETAKVVATTSPSMDIQVSSNFERLMFEAGGRDAGAVRTAMDSLRQSGAFTLDGKTLERINGSFSAGSASIGETAETIDTVLKGSGYLCDPHTAVAVKVAREKQTPSSRSVILSTAHPAKFPDAVRDACGVDPALPAWLGDLMDREEKFTVLAPNAETVQLKIKEKARIFAQGVKA
jgi:threonine synthase